MNETSLTKSEVIQTVLIETGWLAGAFFGALVICYFLLNINIQTQTAQVQVYDTHLVLSAKEPVATLFFLLAFGGYLIRAIQQRFSRASTNGILLAAGLLLLVPITMLNTYLLTEAVPVGYVVYPPLAAVPTIPAGGDALSKLIATVTSSLVVFQLLVIVILLYAAFRWGRQVR